MVQYAKVYEPNGVGLHGLFLQVDAIVQDASGDVGVSIF